MAVDRTQTQVLFSAEQTRRFKELQMRLSDNKVLGNPQPRKASEVVDQMLEALEQVLNPEPTESP